MTEQPAGTAEFDLITRIQQRAGTREDVVLGIGDDAALLLPRPGQQLVVAMDTLNAGVHFPEETAPADIGWKALAVNLSDLAAMGATPAWCTLSLSLPGSDAVWVDAFLDGFLDLAQQYGVVLVGGDITRGPLSISVTVHGFVAPGRALRRDAARVGDEVWVSGTLGDAAGALAQWRAVVNGARADSSDEGSDDDSGDERTTLPGVDVAGTASVSRELLLHLNRPTPRVAVGLALADVAHACIDVSDGLLADLAHVAAASGVGVELRADALPISTTLVSAFDEASRLALQAAGGDDYELCFTAPADSHDAVQRISAALSVPLTRVGVVTAAAGQVRLLDVRGVEVALPRRGYVHFG